MIKNHLFQFILPIIGSLSTAYSVISQVPLVENKYFLLENVKFFEKYKYEGIYAINDYGWYVTQKSNTPPQQLEPLDRLHDIKTYIPHQELGFAIFKVDSGNDAQRCTLPNLKYLADQEDLQINANWVTSLSFISDVSSSSEHAHGNRVNHTQPLNVISKIQKQENGLLYLTSGDSVENFYQETWTGIKEKGLILKLKNVDHIQKQVQKFDYETRYFQQITPELIQKKIQEFIVKKEGYRQRHISNYYITFPGEPLPETFTKELEQSEAFRKLDKFIQMLNTNTILNSNIILRNTLLWEEHVKELKRNRVIDLQTIELLKAVAESYVQMKSEFKIWFKCNITNYFKSTFLGVAERKDHGGLILTHSKDIYLDNNQYCYYPKVAGITCVKEDDGCVEGEQSIAIDLTTPEVHDWISKTIDAYYDAPQELSDKGKRPLDESGPSDPNKKPRIKEKPVDDDTARNPNTFPIKQEVKEEIKPEI